MLKERSAELMKLLGPPNPSEELKIYLDSALKGKVPELTKGGRMPLIADIYGENKARIRIPWGVSQAFGCLEKSYFVYVEPEGDANLIREGFFKTDGHDW